MIETSTIVLVVIVALAILIVIKAIAIVPQQHAWVVERLGKFDRVLSPGAAFVIPSSSAWPTSTRSRNPAGRAQPGLHHARQHPAAGRRRAVLPGHGPDARVYGASNYILAITQLARTTLRSVIGKMELDRTFEERDAINNTIVSSLDEAALNWGVKVLRYEIRT